MNPKLNFLLATDRRSKKGWMGGEPFCSCAKINFSLLFKDVRVALVQLRLNLVFKIIHNINCPQQLENYLLKRSAFHTRDFRDSTLLNIVATKTKMGQTSFKCTAAREWNLLPKDIREIQSLSKFKAIVFEYFLEHDKSNHLCSLK